MRYDLARLFVRVRKHARRTDQSMRSLVEEGLRRCLDAKRPATGYRLPDLSVGEAGAATPPESLSRYDVRDQICLGSGAVLNAAIGGYHGKDSDEQALLRTQLDTLQSGDLLLGDAYYASYFLLCGLQERGVEAVFEQHGARQRSIDFRCGQRLGPRDHLIDSILTLHSSR